MTTRSNAARSIRARAAFSILAVLTACTASAEAQGSCRQVGGAVRLPTVTEASGAALGRRTPGIIWTHNDSGEPVIVALDTAGQRRAQIWVAGAQLVDWEDMAVGPCPTGSCLYVADIGNNGARRGEIVIYRVTEPGLRDQSTSPAEAFRATYPGRAQDAEAIFVTNDGRVFLVTKGETGAVVLFRFPMPLRTGLATRLESVAELSPARVQRAARITGAAISPDGKWIVLRTLGSLRFYRAARLTRGIATRPLIFDIRSARETQGEGVALANDGTVYLLGEGGGKGRSGTFVRMKCEVPKD